MIFETLRAYITLKELPDDTMQPLRVYFVSSGETSIVVTEDFSTTFEVVKPDFIKEVQDLVKRLKETDEGIPPILKIHLKKWEFRVSTRKDSGRPFIYIYPIEFSYDDNPTSGIEDHSLLRNAIEKSLLTKAEDDDEIKTPLETKLIKEVRKNRRKKKNTTAKVVEVVPPPPEETLGKRIVFVWPEDFLASDLSKWPTADIDLPLDDITAGLAEACFGFSGGRLLSYKYQAPDFSKPAPNISKKDKTDEALKKIPKREKLAIETISLKEKEEGQLLLRKLISKSKIMTSTDGSGLTLLNVKNSAPGFFSWNHMTFLSSDKLVKVD